MMRYGLVIVGMVTTFAWGITPADYKFIADAENEWHYYAPYFDEYNPQIAQQARKAVHNRGCNASDQHCKVQAILDLVSAIDYQLIPRNDPGTIRQNPDDMFKNGSGNCVDKTVMTIKMLKVLNIKSFAVMVPQHIFPIVYIKTPLSEQGGRYGDKTFTIQGKTYYHLEPTAKGAYVGYSSFDPTKPYVIFDPETKERIR